MDREQRKLFIEGREMYHAFQHHRKYRGKAITYPTDENYKDLARMLDLKVSYVKKRIETFLFN